MESSVERYNPSISEGLTSQQVENRRKSGLTNSVKKKYSKSYLSIFCGNLFTVFNLLGLIVTIALISVNAPISDFFYALIYLCNIFIGIVQEIRAKRCIDKLTITGEKLVTVIRNGEKTEISSKDIVLDEIISLKLGNQIPTDGIICEGEAEVNESLLTGESVPVKKKVGDPVYAGSFIVGGKFLMKADKVGRENYVEKLSEKAKKYKKPYSELMYSLRFIIKVIGAIIVPIAVAFMLKSTLIKNVELSLAIKRTSTLVIGMIPSGMFLLTSMTLAVGVIKLGRHNTLVQDLYSLEMLARVDTVCFDKTGTITDGKMTVKQLIPLVPATNFEYESVISSMLAVLKDNNQTAIALSDKFGDDKIYTEKSFLPFNSARKLSAVTFENLGTFTFGAPEFILNEEEYGKMKDRVDEYAKQGLRVLLFARSENEISNETLPSDFSPLALILIADNIRDDAIPTIQWFKDNSVNIKVISGDNPVTVSEVSKRVGIDNADKYISLEGLSDDEVIKCANEYTVFGRVSPEQKALLVHALKQSGHTVAMTGDGVNDILAMKESDCAVTVASGSDATRNISNLVLMDNNFNSLPKVVYEGRRVINNVQSSASLFLMKTIFTMCLSLITLILPNYVVYPFQLTHMIMLEVFVIGLPAFFLSLQPNDSLVEGKFIVKVFSRSIPNALLILMSFIFVETFRAIWNVFPDEVYVTMQAYVITFAGAISLFNVCKPFNAYRTIMFGMNFAFIIVITGIGIFRGFMSSYVPLVPFEKYWHHLLFVLGVILLDIPCSYLFEKLFKNFKLSDRNLKKTSNNN